MKIQYSDVTMDRDYVLKRVNCLSDSPVYEDVVQAYEELRSQVKHLAEAACLFAEGEITEADQTEEYPAGMRILYVLTTVGEPLSRLGSELLEAGDYLKGAMADAMADSCLFELEKQWLPAVKDYCLEHGIGVRRRLEPPNGLPIHIQKTAWEYLHAKEELGIEITEGSMYQPMKTLCQILVISEEPCLFLAEHDCRFCSCLDCPNRSIKPVTVKVATGNEGENLACELQLQEGESILAAYQRQEGYVSAVCNGRGSCGKCRIQLLEGELAVTQADQSCFREAELAQGYRLACQAYPNKDCRIRVCFLQEEGFSVLNQFADLNEADLEHWHEGQKTESGLGIAVDIGTTTLAAQMINLEDGQLLAAASSVNHQRAYGADVVSRLEAANAGKGAVLQRLIRRDLNQLVEQLLHQSKRGPEQVKKVILAGNTVMCHLLLGYSCESLGVFPFQPVDIGLIHGTYRELTGSDRLSADTWIFPGFSAYVGADIAAGLYACRMDQSRSVKLFVDLGTNGEMALGTGEHLLTASVAAGPAFEGGNLSCGVGSIPGAVSHIRLKEDGVLSLETIQQKPPVGLCGTGVIELTSELLRTGQMDETGLLDERWQEQGYPFAENAEGEMLYLTQKDIREIQLAKAAVRAGVETLMRRYGIGCEEISEVLLAGGMGFGLDQEAALRIGLLPETLKGKIRAVGNTALAGCVYALRDASWQNTARQLVEHAKEISLAVEEDFAASYVEQMVF